jgi:Rieske Fe-S protein
MPATRRRFLQVCSVGAAACAIAGCGSSPSAPAAFGDVSAGNIKDIPVGALQAIPMAPAFIARDAGGLYALTATCTHRGCGVTAQGSGATASLFCPCHGSSFDRNGAVTGGPAPAPLAHFAVEVDMMGNVTVHGGIQVDAATRVPVA